MKNGVLSNPAQDLPLSMSTVSTVGGPLYSEYSDEYSEYSVSTVSGTHWCHCVPLSERYTDCVLCNTVHTTSGQL